MGLSAETSLIASEYGLIDRLEIRCEIGRAVRTIQAADDATFEETKAERERLHKEWRDAIAIADKKKAAYDFFIRHRRISVKNSGAAALIAKAKREHHDLLTYRDDPDETPVICAASGLAVFDGDELYGDDPQCGPVILKKAVALRLTLDLALEAHKEPVISKGQASAEAEAHTALQSKEGE